MRLVCKTKCNNNRISAGCALKRRDREEVQQYWAEVSTVCRLNTVAVTAGYRLQYVIVATSLSWQELMGSCNLHSSLIAVLSGG